MAVLPTGIGPVTGYNIERSLRFNSADSAYLNRTPASAGNRKTWTWSGWVKRSQITTARLDLFAVYGALSDTGFFELQFGSTSAETIRIVGYNTIFLNTTQLFRDSSSWYHIVLAFDSTQATASNRMRLYVNGVEVTAFSTDNRASITQNGDFGINQAAIHTIGAEPFGPNFYFNGYMAEVNFVDGQAKTPSDFGETDSNTGVWKPKAYTGTYGTNGFYLKFADNSNTTAGTLGKDSSGNGNNWTPNNFSVTAGAGNDSMVDSPTAYGTDTGVGGEVRGNYATWNPLAKSLLTGTFTFSNGNLDVSDAASSYGAVLATLGASSGKWYWEVTCVSSGGSSGYIGIVPSSATDPTVFGYPGAGGSYSYSTNGQKFTSNSGTTYGATYTTGDIIGVALDLDAGTLVFYKNGSSQGTAFSSLSGSFVPSVGDGAGATQYSWTANFGQRAFAYTAPSGFKALCTQNLPTPTIGATSTTQANDYFNPVLYTGTGSSLGVTGVGFQPDLVWIKGRSGATDHGWYDAVRGVQKQLESNTTTAETTETTGLTAFGTDGFTVGALAQLNTSSATYVAWNWKANGAGSSNTAGTITSTVSANTTSGFSIVTYTGNATSGATIGHGLGVAPSMVIVKNRSTATNWPTWHTSIANTELLKLNLTDAKATDTAAWNSTTPTSTVVTLGNSTGTNGSGNSLVAYCFAPVAGYSAFGSYTGNGSTDGPFVYTGFRPRYILWKVSSGTTGHWEVVDTARETYNQSDQVLFASSSGAESAASSSYYMDILSNGFKIRNTDTSQNGNTYTYIYAAFAESPFKYALAR